MMGAVAKPTIGIIGTGAIGGFYGVMLARAGFDVHFLLRSEFAAVAERGLQVDSAVHGALTLNPVQAYSSAEDMPPCDWLLVGAKTTSNAALAPAILQAAAPNAKILLLQNGLDVRELVGMLLDPFEGQGLGFLQVIMRVMLTTVTLDLAHLFAHSGAEHHLLVNEGDAHQIAALSAQAPGHIAQKTQIGIEGRHANFQRRTVAPRAVVIASHAAQADSVQLLP